MDHVVSFSKLKQMSEIWFEYSFRGVKTESAVLLNIIRTMREYEFDMQINRLKKVLKAIQEEEEIICFEMLSVLAFVWVVKVLMLKLAVLDQHYFLNGV